MIPRIPRIFFDPSDHRLLGIVNDVLDPEKRPGRDVKTLLEPYLHPHGIKTLASTGNLRIAYAVVSLIGSLETGRAGERLQSLRALRDEVLTSPTGPMRRNTARVLIQIMKELVRAKSGSLEQLKLAHEFRVAATGKPRIILAQLRKYHLMEMPEEWNQVAFDDRVHDANTKGRKSPTHLIMDAWIKGIRRLTVVHYNFVRPDVARELLESARIMGVEVHVGVELAARHRDRFVNIIWEPKGFTEDGDYLRFLESEPVRAFMDQGREVSLCRRRYVYAVLESFNRNHRSSIMREFGLDLPRLERADFDGYVGSGQPSLVHLGGFIHKTALPLMRERVAVLRQEFAQTADPETRRDIEMQVDALDALDADTFVQRYLLPGDNPGLPNPLLPATDDPELLTLSPLELMTRLRGLHSVNRFVLNTVDLTQADVIELLYDCRGLINHLELFSLRDLVDNRFRDGKALGELREALNSGDVVALKRIILDNIDQLCLGEMDCKAESDEAVKLREILSDINTLAGLYAHNHLHTCIGSGSTGHSSRNFGMGFAILETLPVRAVRALLHRARGFRSLCLPVATTVRERHTYTPRSAVTPLGRAAITVLGRVPLLRRLVRSREVDYLSEHTRVTPGRCGNLVMLGGQVDPSNDLTLSGEAVRERAERLTPFYLNTTLRNWLKVLVGFIPAFLTFSLSQDWWLLAYFGAFIWLGITAGRNVIQSVMGGGGFGSLSLLRWHQYVNWSRIADSLMFTGFSVPLLDWLCKSVLLDAGFGITTATNPVLLYAVMGVTNGLYIFSHNVFRGLPGKAAFWNLFRSALSIPLAVGFNWAAGGLLASFGVAAVDPVLQQWAAVISKLASDCVGGAIEGLVDRGANVHMRVWDYRGKIAQVLSVYARLEGLFPERDMQRMMADPGTFVREVRELEARRGIKEELDKAVMLNALDLLTFWMYQPRAATALKALLREMKPEERRIFFVSQHVLMRERDVSQLFVDGMVGKNFSRALSFYLMRYPGYLRALDAMLLRLGGSGSSGQRPVAAGDEAD
ncbi:MAG: hypothetical protein KUA35_04790 [Pseudodesulfovibrio sp.]|uniref:Uncharacterized protein n=1 Tax=Pseudodesulfovibrio aespoeensis (strain ATCC 700646 / DSM 10631 / Aspo-2) TaxID=643562 RepID=E6VRW1_PSEA9|nr:MULTISPECIES: hypothetical protein [Pseudodesulfovibrio]MBU4191789.1 hypothetical protein [Pseudomonadota bacterium]ADU64248.1 hypothetical protein Daes_3259 [Pseudodesulfovibrio aespoeensis Aspo-2]MBU4243007.1 hypothetical protein [Pseudomonadota bacterium]MBU4380298.1 hypothetical protein [Pseudomonadota bacterium]MBU4474834.1 hypothetical protein [Pseudomonadota bacterium]